MSAIDSQLPSSSGQDRPTDEVDRILSPGKLIILGLQHVLVMYAGAVAVPLMIGDLKWSTKTGHRVRVFSSIDFPIRLVVT
ncbi:solute carrier family 23 protein, partial [Escherichia coli]